MVRRAIWKRIGWLGSGGWNLPRKRFEYSADDLPAVVRRQVADAFVAFVRRCLGARDKALPRRRRRRATGPGRSGPRGGAGS